jgi:hypothetical protein
MPLSVRIDPKTEEKLRHVLAETGGSLSEFVRAAVDEKLAREVTKASPAELGKAVFGRRGSGRNDLSAAHETILRERLRDRHRR